MKQHNTEDKITAGIMIVKKNSIRFPGKNFHHFKGKPLFANNVDALLGSIHIDTVYVGTDSDIVSEYYKFHKNVHVIKRGCNISKDDQSLYDVLKYIYYSIYKQYDIMACVLANCINHKSSDMDRAIQLLIDKHLNEIRSFNSDGVENGIVIIRTGVFEIKHEISAYIGAVISDGKEVHHVEDLR